MQDRWGNTSSFGWAMRGDSMVWDCCEQIGGLRRCWVSNLFSKRLMVRRVIMGETVLNLISVYAPDTSKQMVEKEEFFTSLGKIVSGSRKGRLITNEIKACRQ